MDHYRKLILDKLLDRYERSGHYTKPGCRNRPVVLRYTREEFPEYWLEPYGDYRPEINRVSKELAALGVIEISWSGFAYGQVLAKAMLVLENVVEAYRLADRTPRADQEAAIGAVVEKWSARWGLDEDLRPVGGKMDGWQLATGIVPPWVGDFIRAIREAQSSRRRLPAGLSTGDDRQLDRLLQVLDGAATVKGEVSKMQFSTEVLGHPRALDGLETPLTRVLKEFLPGGAVLEDARELLAELGIVETPQPLLLAGSLKFSYYGRELSSDPFEPYLGLPWQVLAEMENLRVDASRLVLVASQAAFCRLASKGMPGALVVWAGGSGPCRRAWLQRLWRAMEGQTASAVCVYWGSFDLAGFRLWHFLRKQTGIPLQPYLMDVHTYQDHLQHGAPFDEACRRKLAAMLDQPDYQPFHGVIGAMLQYGLRVDQDYVPVP